MTLRSSRLLWRRECSAVSVQPRGCECMKAQALRDPPIWPFWIMHSSPVHSGYPVSFIQHFTVDRTEQEDFLFLFSTWATHTHTNHFPAFWAKKAPCVHAWEIISTFIIHRLRTAAWCANMWVFVRVFTCVWRVFVIHSGRVSKVCLSVGSSGGLLCSTCQFSPLYRAPQAAKKVEPCRVWWPVSSPSRSQSTRWYSCTTMEIQSRDGLGWVAAAAPAVPPPLACLSTNSSAEKL